MKRSQTLVPALLLALAETLSAWAQPARQVRDINRDGAAEPQTRENAEQLHVVGRRAVFFSGLPRDYYESPREVRLWADDGEGSETLASFCIQFCSFAPFFVGATPGALYFFAADENGSNYDGTLWRTDGTRAGTLPIWPASGVGYVSTVSILEGRLAFGGCADSGGCGLWLSDGSAAGTRRVSPVSPFDMTVADGRLYFLGSDGHPGLFVSDGTTAGTRVVRRLPDDGGYLWLLTAAGSRLYFMTGEDSGELWTSDGTEAGTHWIQTFPESGHEWMPRYTNFLLPRGERIYFLAAGGLWTTDGQGRGRRRASLLSRHFVRSRVPGDFAFLPGGLLYGEEDGITGDRLWLTREAPESTAIVSGCPGGCPSLSSPELLPLGDGRVLFGGEDLAHGAELWITDGTGGGTHLVSDLCPGPCGSDPRGFRSVAGKVFFTGRPGPSGTAPALFTTDLTAAGTVPLAALDEEGAAELQVVGFPGRWFFTGFDAVHGRQVWTSDGTPRGTRLASVVEPPAPSAVPQGLASLGGRLLFTAHDGRERNLWAADPAGLDAAPLLAPGALGPDGAAAESTVAGRFAYFFNAAAGTAPEGERAAPELWRSDGTAPGTVRLASFPGGRLSLPIAMGDRFFFLVSSTLGEPPLHSLWESDGTAAGTQRRVALPDDALRVVRGQAIGGEIYLVVRRETAHQLFRSDGTPAGTRPIYTFECESCLDEAEKVHLVAAHGSLYFTTWIVKPESPNRTALVRTDGTAAGTVQVLPDPARPLEGQVQPWGPLAVLGSDLVYLAYDPTARPGSYYPYGLFRGVDPPVLIRSLAYNGDGDLQTVRIGDPGQAGARLLFRGGDRHRGIELWATDGTTAGTGLVRDLVPGSLSGDPRGLVAAGGRLYFSAFDPEHGRELWRSDGTEAGTLRLQDIAPGAASSNPEALTEAGGQLYFTADDGLTGRELWSLPLAPPPSTTNPCRPLPTRLCLGTYAVEVSRRDGAGLLSAAHAEPLDATAGLFSFAAAENPEVAVKIVDGRGTNGHTWVVYGALTSEEIVLTLTDSATGATRRYFKPAGLVASAGDRFAFGPQGAKRGAITEGPAPTASPLSAAADAFADPRGKSACVADGSTLCLQEGRFAVRVERAGSAAPVRPLAGGNAGTFSLSSSPTPSGIDGVVKVLDGRPVDGHFWLFLAGLTDAPYRLTVTDTATGKTRSYTNRAGRFSATVDTLSF